MTEEQKGTIAIQEENNALALPKPEVFKGKLQAINQFQQIVHSNLIPEADYGVIPGTTKPTLLKPGAEKIAKLLNLADEYEIIDRQEDWQKGFFRYLIKCKLRHIGSSVVVAEGMGECNSMESRYRWREAKRICPLCGAETIIKSKREFGGGWICFTKMGGCGAKWADGASEVEGQKIGRVENEDIFSQVNTILKLSKKRALVDAALSAGRLSNVFTQDLEDASIKVNRPKVREKGVAEEIEEKVNKEVTVIVPETVEITDGWVAQTQEVHETAAAQKQTKETEIPTEPSKTLKSRREFREREFLASCMAKLGLTTEDVYERTSVNHVSEIADLHGAWEFLKRNNPPKPGDVNPDF